MANYVMDVLIILMLNGAIFFYSDFDVFCLINFKVSCVESRGFYFSPITAITSALCYDSETFINDSLKF